MSAAGFLPAGAAGADLNGAFKTETMGLSINPSDAQFVAPPRDLAFVPEEESQQTESDGDGFDLEDDGEVGEGDQLRTQRGDPKNPIKAFPCLTNHFDDGPVAAVKDEGPTLRAPLSSQASDTAGVPVRCSPRPPLPSADTRLRNTSATALCPCPFF